MADETIFELSGDATKSIEAIDAIISALDKLKESFDTLSNVFEVLDRIDNAFDVVSGTVGDFGKAIAVAADSFTKFDEASAGATQAAQNVADTTKAVDDASKNIATSLQQASDALREESDASKAVADANKQMAAAMADATKAIQETADALKAEIDAGASADQVAQQIAAMNQQLLDGAVKADTMLKNVNKLVDSLLTLSDEADKAASSIQATGDATGKFDDSIKLTEEITAAAGDRIKTLAESVNMLDDAFKIAGDSVASFAKAADAGVAAETKMAEEAKVMSTAMLESAKSAEVAATASKEMGSIFSADAVNLMILQTMVGNAAKSFLQMGIDAQTSLSQMTGLADQSLRLAENQGKLNDIIKQTEAAALKYGVTMKDAGDALYFVASAGFDTGDALKIMNSVMEASAATGAKAESVSVALISILKSYNMQGSDAKKVTDEMTQAVVQGNQTFEQFANVIGGVASEASRAGVSFEEAAAAESTMSILQPRVRQDGQNLIHLFQNLHDKMDKIAEAAKAMGKHFDENAFQSMSLIDKLKYIAQIAGGDTTKAFRDLTGDVTGTKTAYMLLHDGTAAYTKILGDEMKSLGATDIALQEHEKTIQGAAERIKAAASVISYEIVRMASPLVVPIMQKIADSLDYLSQHMDKARPYIAAFGAALATIMAGSTIALIGFLLSLLGPIAPIAAAMGIAAAAAVKFSDGLKGMSGEAAKVPPLILLLRKYFEDFGHWAKNELPTPWQEAQAKIMDFVHFLQDTIPQMLQILGANIKKQLTIIFGMIKEVITEKLQELGIKFSEKIPDIEQIIVTGFNHINDAISHLSDWFTKLWTILDQLKTPLAVLGGAILGARAALLIISIATDGWAATLLKAAPALVPIITNVAKLIPIFEALISPIGLAAIAIGALIAYGLKLMQDSGELSQILSMLWDTMKAGATTIKNAWNELVAQWNSQVIPAWNELMKTLGPLKPLFDELAKALARLPLAMLIVLIVAFVAAIKAAIEVLKALITVLTDVINIVDGIAKAVKAFVKIFVDLAHGDFKAAGKDIENTFVGINKAGANTAKLVGDSFGLLGKQMTILSNDGAQGTLDNFKNMQDQAVGNSIIPDMVKAIIKWFKQLGQEALQPVKDFCDKILKFFSDLADKLVGHSIVPDMMKSITKVFTEEGKNAEQAVEDFVKSVEQFFNDLNKNASQVISDMWKNLTQNISQGAQGALQGITDFVSKATDKVKELAQKSPEWGRDFMNGLGQGIMSAASSVLTGVLSIASQISSMLHFSRPDTGPLADYESWMPDFGTGLAEGLTNQTGKVRSAAQQVAQAIATSMPTTQSLSGFTSSSAPANDAILAVLKDIHATLKQNGTQQTSGGRALTSAQIATVQQQYFMNAMQSGNINNLYTQLNQLMGLSAEYSGRGSATGLGW